MPATQVEYLTPPAIAKRLGVSCEKVIGWLLAGELRGSNLAAKLGGRPRYRVSEADLSDFLERRSASVPPVMPRRRKQTSNRRFY
jgi:transposase